MSQSPRIEEVIDAAIEEQLDHVFTAMPGRIVSYNETNARVDVQPDVRQFFLNENGEEVSTKLPIIKNVPLVQPGSGYARITFPVAVGHTCLLVFANCELDSWKSTTRASNGGGDDVTPRINRRFRVSDAIAIVGLVQSEFAAAKLKPATDRIQIGYADGPKVDINQSTIALGGSATQLEGMATEAVVVQSALDLFIQALTNAANSAALAPVPMAPGKTALLTLLTALTTGIAPPAPPIIELAGGWTAGTTVTKAK